MGRSMGRFSIPKIGGGDGPKVAPAGGGQDQGIGTLMGYIMGQQKQGQAAQNMQQAPAQRFNMSDDEAQNFEPHPQLMDVGGVPTAQVGLEEKKSAPESQFGSITQGRATAGLLKNNVDQVIGDKGLRDQMGYFHPSAHTGFVGNLAMNVRSLLQDPNVGSFAEFKSNTENVFQNYRKFLEGVRGAVGGSGLIDPIYPKTEDPPEVYVGKALGALDTMKKNDDSYVDSIKRAGYKPDRLEGGFPIKDTNELRQNAGNAGLKVRQSSPIPGSPGYGQASSSASDSSQQADPKAEYQLASQAIQSGKIKDINKVKAAFKNRTGEDYDSFQQ